MFMRIELPDREPHHVPTQRQAKMLWALIAVFLILWLLGFSLSIGGSVIHLLVVVAPVVFVINPVRGRRAA